MHYVQFSNSKYSKNRAHITHRNLYTNTHKQRISQKQKSGNKLVSPSANELISNTWHVPTTEYYSTIKRNKVPATT